MQSSRFAQPGIDNERVALRAAEINRRGQTDDTAADDNHFANVGMVEIGGAFHS